MILTADSDVGFLSKVERSCVRNKMQILSNRPRAVKPMDENSNVFFSYRRCFLYILRIALFCQRDIYSAIKIDSIHLSAS